MNIAQIVCVYPPYGGGMGTVAFELTQALVNRGHDVTVFTPQVGDPSINDQETVHRLAPVLRYGNAAYLPQLYTLLSDFDVVHLHYPFFGTAHLVDRWKAKHPHKPLVLTYHMDSRARGVKGLLFDVYTSYWLPKILAKADALIASSFDYVAVSDAERSYRKNSSVWHEIPFGVDTSRFQFRPKSETLITRYALSKEIPTIVFVGGMDAPHYFKGIDILLQAIARLHATQHVCQAVFVGDGALRERYIYYAKGLGIEKYVRFVGYVSAEELPYHYNLGDVFVLPSINRGEAFGMVLLEAMASGVPVIASDFPGVRTVARDGGITVPPKQPEALADALITALFSPSRRLPSSDTLRHIVAEKYAWDTIAKAHESVYKQLVQ